MLDELVQAHEELELLRSAAQTQGAGCSILLDSASAVTGSTSKVRRAVWKRSKASSAMLRRFRTARHAVRPGVRARGPQHQ
jgi:hypothetical protein